MIVTAVATDLVDGQLFSRFHQRWRHVSSLLVYVGTRPAASPRALLRSLRDTPAQRRRHRPIPTSGCFRPCARITVPSSEIRTRVGDRELNLSNLDKVLYPLTGYTKAEVVNYYVAIAPVLLPPHSIVSSPEFASRRSRRTQLLREERPQRHA